MTALSDFQQFVNDVQSSSTYKGWAKQNPNDASRWVSVRDALLAGKMPTIPIMSTAFGKSLIDEARETEHFKALEQSPASPPTDYGQAIYGESSYTK